MGPLINGNNKTIVGDGEMAKVLNEYFTSVFTREPEGPVPNPGTEEAESLLEDIVITEVDILKKIKDLRRGAAAGPDGIGPAFLQDFRQILAPALQVLFRKILDEGVAPADWRKANVTPIFKKGAKCDPGNYRPVTCKIFESIVRDNLVKHLEGNNLIKSSQHGFFRDPSCTTNL